MASRRARKPTTPRRAVAAPAPATRSWILQLLLAVATLAAYQPAWHGGRLWDDDAHLTVPALASWSGLGRIWTDVTVTQQFYPIVSSAFWIMNRLWGHDTFGYHIVNILLHAFSAWLVVLILRRLSVKGAVIAGVVFALHPVQVESVAWMSELKNTLSGVFYLLAVFAYLRFDETRERRWYAAAAIAFLLALGSKTVTATLPAALLILIWWRRGRINWRVDVPPLAALLGVGILAGAATAWLEYAWVGAKGGAFDLTIVERVLLASRATWFYAMKIVWPVNLVFNYPRWTIDQSVWWQYLFPLALLAVIAGSWAIRARSRAPLAAVLFYGVTLFPALGFVNVFPFRYSYVADHFQYLASLGLIAACSAGLYALALRWRPRVSETTVAIVIGASLLVLTFSQSRQYAGSEMLYRTTIARNPESLLARTNLAADLLDGPKSGWPEAMMQAQEAVRIDPNDAPAHSNLGLAYQHDGRHEDAVRELREAARLDPQLAAAHSNLAISLGALGRSDEAAAEYRQALQIFPAQPEVLYNLAKLFALQGRYAEALPYAKEAARLAPQSPDIVLNYANTVHASGAAEESIPIYVAALQLRPAWGEADHNLGMALQRTGRNDDALAAFLEAERLMPSAYLVEVSLGRLLVTMNRLDEAASHLVKAAQLAEAPRSADIYNELGVVLARLGKNEPAAQAFQLALQIRPDLASARENLMRLRRGRGPSSPPERP